MKKYLLLIFALATVATTLAQQPQSPVVFRNHAEYLLYQAEHPERLPMKIHDAPRAMTLYSQKLDSVIGSNDFDRIRWKNVYSYTEVDEHPSDAIMVETSYLWDNSVWVPSVKSEVRKNAETDLVDKEHSYLWNETDWEPYLTADYYYSENQLLDSVLIFRYADTVWQGYNRALYEYDDEGRLVFCLICSGQNAEGIWVESTKYENTYTDDGKLSFTVMYNKRGNTWREYLMDTLTYNDQGQCTVLLTRMRGMGPGGGGWRDNSKYVFDYQDGNLVSETLYSSGWAWFSSQLNLDSKNEYQFDAEGNLTMKTSSVYNEVEWMPRDVYENHFNSAVNADEILGLRQIWDATVESGMGYLLDQEMPLMSQWNSCIIASQNLDTEFHLYYSGFAAVDETENVAFDAFGTEGRLMVRCPEPCDLTVYDLLGRVVATRAHAQQAEFALIPGLYIVSDGTQRVKTIVR